MRSHCFVSYDFIFIFNCYVSMGGGGQMSTGPGGAKEGVKHPRAEAARSCESPSTALARYSTHF